MFLHVKDQINETERLVTCIKHVTCLVVLLMGVMAEVNVIL